MFVTRLISGIVLVAGGSGTSDNLQRRLDFVWNTDHRIADRYV